MKLSDLKVNEYQLWTSPQHMGMRDITLVRRRNAEGPDRWAIHDGVNCLTKKGKWEYERIPSNRSAYFFRRCRFDTPEEALAVWEKYKVAEKLDEHAEEMRQLIARRNQEWAEQKAARQ